MARRVNDSNGCAVAKYPETAVGRLDPVPPAILTSGTSHPTVEKWVRLERLAAKIAETLGCDVNPDRPVLEQLSPPRLFSAIVTTLQAQPAAKMAAVLISSEWEGLQLTASKASRSWDMRPGTYQFPSSLFDGLRNPSGTEGLISDGDARTLAAAVWVEMSTVRSQLLQEIVLTPWEQHACQLRELGHYIDLLGSASEQGETARGLAQRAMQHHWHKKTCTVHLPDEQRLERWAMLSKEDVELPDLDLGRGQSFRIGDPESAPMWVSAVVLMRELRCVEDDAADMSSFYRCGNGADHHEFQQDLDAFASATQFREAAHTEAVLSMLGVKAFSLPSQVLSSVWQEGHEGLLPVARRFEERTGLPLDQTPTGLTFSEDHAPVRPYTRATKSSIDLEFAGPSDPSNRKATAVVNAMHQVGRRYHPTSIEKRPLPAPEPEDVPAANADALGADAPSSSSLAQLFPYTPPLADNLLAWARTCKERAKSVGRVPAETPRRMSERRTSDSKRAMEKEPNGKPTPSGNGTNVKAPNSPKRNEVVSGQSTSRSHCVPGAHLVPIPPPKSPRPPPMSVLPELPDDLKKQLGHLFLSIGGLKGRLPPDVLAALDPKLRILFYDDGRPTLSNNEALLALLSWCYTQNPDEGGINAALLKGLQSLSALDSSQASDDIGKWFEPHELDPTVERLMRRFRQCQPVAGADDRKQFFLSYLSELRRELHQCRQSTQDVMLGLATLLKTQQVELVRDVAVAGARENVLDTLLGIAKMESSAYSPLDTGWRSVTLLPKQQRRMRGLVNANFGPKLVLAAAGAKSTEMANLVVFANVWLTQDILLEGFDSWSRGGTTSEFKKAFDAARTDILRLRPFVARAAELEGAHRRAAFNAHMKELSPTSVVKDELSAQTHRQVPYVYDSMAVSTYLKMVDLSVALAQQKNWDTLVALAPTDLPHFGRPSPRKLRGVSLARAGFG